MDDKVIKSFSINRGSFQDGDYSATFHAHKIPSLGIDSFSWPPKNERKFNIRIKREDLCLLDAMASYHGITRSVIINKLLNEILLKELMDIDDNAIDARALIATIADKMASYDNLTSPWIWDAIGPQLSEVRYRILHFNTPVSGSDAEQWGVDGHSSIYSHVIGLWQGQGVSK